MRVIRSTLSIALLAVAAMAVPRPALAADDYPVKFERPSKVGDRYKLTVTEKQTTEQSIKVAGASPPKQSRELTVTLTGDVKVVAVTEKGRVTKVECAVGKLEVTPAGGQPQEPIVAGKVLVAERVGKKKVLSVDGQPVAPPLQQVLNDLLSVDQTDGPGDDAQFGTPDRKKPGDAWDGNADAMRDGAAEAGVPVKKDGASAKIRFTEVKKLDGADAGVFQCDMTAQIDPAGPMPDLPPGVKLESGSMKANNVTVLPLDPTAKGRGDTSDVTIEMTMSGDAPNGAGKLTLTVLLKRHQESMITPAK